MISTLTFCNKIIKPSCITHILQKLFKIYLRNISKRFTKFPDVHNAEDLIKKTKVWKFHHQDHS